MTKHKRLRFTLSPSLLLFYFFSGINHLILKKAANPPNVPQRAFFYFGFGCSGYWVPHPFAHGNLYPCLSDGFLGARVMKRGGVSPNTSFSGK